MDSTRSTSEPILAMAKRQLGMHPRAADSAVPKAYQDELKQLLETHANDTNFIIQLQPKIGFGIITCLEQGCNRARINLGESAKRADGGKKDGLGSLWSYRVHANQPTHKQGRLSRLKGGASPVATNDRKPNTTVAANQRKRPSLLNALDAAPGSSSTSAIRAKAEPSELVIPKKGASFLAKPEPSDSVIPMKRPSSSHVGTAAASGSTSASASRNPVKKEDSFSYEKPSPPKKMKEEASKMPLTFIDFNMGAMATQLQRQPQFQPPALTQSEILAKLEDVNRRYAAKEADSRLLVVRRSKVDKRRFTTLKREMDRLHVERQRYSALLQSLSAPQTRLEIPKTPARLTLAPPNTAFNIQDRKPIIQPVASGSNVRMPDVYIPNVHGYRDIKTGNDTTDDEGMASDVNMVPGLPASAMNDEQPYGENYDSNGNWFGRGRDTFVGPQANPDDINQFLVAAGNSEQFDGNASIEHAMEELGLKNQYELLPSMAVALMPHQIIGVAWMKKMELGAHMMRGGILADEMGLGKTVQMIAVMTLNQATGSDIKTNLILAPTALLDQWKLEIETKTNDALTCYIYHGARKAKKISELVKYDVVLTTYSTMALEWPDYENEEKAKKKKAKKNDFIETDSDDNIKPDKKQKQRGLLFRMKWYRVICDEAQNLRNKRTRTARAVTDLDAKYRWCLTGTPITNAISDAYSLLRFLKIRPWYDWQYFNEQIARYEKRNPTLATNKLQTIFKLVLLRRKKDSQLDGKRLIELPDKTVTLQKLEFTEEERAIYQMVETRSQEKFNNFLRAGTVLKNYHQVLVLLLRLRQICSHPALIQENGVALAGVEDLDETLSPATRGELNRAAALVGPEFVAKMKFKLKELTLRRMEAEKASVDAVIEDEDCPICMDVFTDATVTACAHTFCKYCITSVVDGPAPAQDANEPNMYKAKERPCPSCRSPVSADFLFPRLAFEPTEADLYPNLVKDEDEDVKPGLSDILEDADDVKTIGKGKGKARPKRLRRGRIVDSEDDSEGEADSDMDDFIVHSDEDEEDKNIQQAQKKRLGKRRAFAMVESDSEIDEEDEDIIHGRRMRSDPKEDEDVQMLPSFLPSTKMKRMMDLLIQWAEEHPDEKTLIISQWTQCLQLVSNYLTENGFLHVKYQGDMSRPKRDAAVRVFMAKDKAQVMLMSLKCGGVGLNLTRANRVISLDLGWSEAVEAQAFDRVHRLGQQRNVFVERLVIADTAEDRVLVMQERKKAIADGSLGEGTGKKLGRLSVRELANLFGLDGNGKRLQSA
ncbi:hypothetical protein FIBSPDRAFT_917412 [Athelia psychrophila]|uniref:Uncharacterized protein n=1 Tax=Athelia psychrophila TaxID=1759441 RepID=A0A166SCG7_9AGAM|nr:hypothetical protein FIBSPDRAFT_917412 [Fibularhizoctonia sp. CBS 109695]